VLSRLFLLFTLLPIVEIVLLVWLADKTSVPFVLGLVVVTGLVGVALVRYQGWVSMRRISADLERGKMPAEPLVDGVLVLLAAALLILPGVLSDALAIALLFPPTRRLVKALFRRGFQARVVRIVPTDHGFDVPADRIIDVRVVEGPDGGHG
jgi:UPF0716 protein FxsA